MRTLWLAAVLATVPLEHAHGWGQEGHSIVAEIAQRRVEPAALEKIYKLLRSELPGLKGNAPVSLASIASWADDYRPTHDETRNWHFVDIPYDRDTYRPDEDCRLDPKYGDCAVNAIARAPIAGRLHQTERRTRGRAEIPRSFRRRHPPAAARDLADRPGYRQPRPRRKHDRGHALRQEDQELREDQSP